MKISYHAQFFSAHKWHPFCQRDTARAARDFARLKNPHSAIRVLRVTTEIVSPYLVR